jgi:hypothetical protein
VKGSLRGYILASLSRQSIAANNCWNNSPILGQSHESTNREQCLVRCLPAHQRERSRRAATNGRNNPAVLRQQELNGALVLPKARPISCSDSPAFQRRHMSAFCSAERPYVFLLSLTPPLRNDLNQMVLHRPVETARLFGNFVEVTHNSVLRRNTFAYSSDVESAVLLLARDKDL